MKQWFAEDWHFRIEVLSVGKENRAEECRLGFEPGDTFTCAFGCPAGFCPTSLFQIFPVLEALRSGGDLRNLGGQRWNEIAVTCPDGVVRFLVRGEQQAP